MSITIVISSLGDDVYDNLGENDFDLFELTEGEREQSLQMHLKMIVRVVMNWMMKTCLCFLLSHVLSGQVGSMLNPNLHEKSSIGNLVLCECVIQA